MTGYLLAAAAIGAGVIANTAMAVGRRRKRRIIKQTKEK